MPVNLRRFHVDTDLNRRIVVALDACDALTHDLKVNYSTLALATTTASSAGDSSQLVLALAFDEIGC